MAWLSASIVLDDHTTIPAPLTFNSDLSRPCSSEGVSSPAEDHTEP